MDFGANGCLGNGYYPRISMDGTIQANPCWQCKAGRSGGGGVPSARYIPAQMLSEARSFVFNLVCTQLRGG